MHSGGHMQDMQIILQHIKVMGTMELAHPVLIKWYVVTMEAATGVMITVMAVLLVILALISIS